MSWRLHGPRRISTYEANIVRAGFQLLGLLGTLTDNKANAASRTKMVDTVEYLRRLSPKNPPAKK